MFAPIPDAPLAYSFVLFLLAVNVYAFLYPAVIINYRMHPYAIYRGFGVAKVFSAALLHINWKHLALNVVVLAKFLPEVEYMLADDFGFFAGGLLLLAVSVGIVVISSALSIV